MLSSGPAYDLSKVPAGSSMLGAEGSNILEANVAARASNPVDHYLENTSQLRQHLEVNYEYAKRVEGAIDTQRQKLAGDMLSMQTRLSGVEAEKQRL